MDASDEFTITFEIIRYLHKPKRYEGRLVTGALAIAVPPGPIIYQDGEICGGPTNRRMLGHPG